MKDSKYLFAVALLSCLAAVFGLVGTVAPALDSVSPEREYPSSSSSSSSGIAHFAYPPTYDSGWMDITDKKGQYMTFEHNLNSTDVFVDITGKQSLGLGGVLQRSQTFGASRSDQCRSLVMTSDSGYALAGITTTDGGNDVWLVKADASGNVLWDEFYGGEGNDTVYSMVKTSDDGYAMAGYTTSFDIGPWLVKTDSTGKMQWNKTYVAAGGATAGAAYSLAQASDDGYVLAITITNGTRGTDFWLVKTDSNGNVLWSEPYGMQSNEVAYSAIQTSDGGYAIAGYTDSTGNKDFWLVKTDSLGHGLWNKTYGGSLPEIAYSLIQTADGGLALCGTTQNWDSYYKAYLQNFWLVKTDSSGSLQWNKTASYAGGGHNSIPYSMIQTANGGYALAGTTSNYGYSPVDGFLVLIDSAGNLQWSGILSTPPFQKHNGFYSLVQTPDGKFTLAGYTDRNTLNVYDFWLVRSDFTFDRTYDGGYTKAYAVIQTSSGGYVVTGCTNSYTWTGSASGGFADFWACRLDSTFGMSWGKRYGGSLNDVAYSLIQTDDGGYALVGSTESYGSGKSDFWLLKIDGLGNQVWNKTVGGTGNEAACSLVQTEDGGYAIAGYTDSYGSGNSDFWLVKTDWVGNVLWNKTYGGSGNDIANSLIRTADGGFALGGYTDSFGTGDSDYLLVRTDIWGNMLWSKTYGGTSNEEAHSLIQTNDEGFALVGYTDSNGGEAWMVKADSAGILQWNKTYVGFDIAKPISLTQAYDRGYALAGSTYSVGTYAFFLLKSRSDGNVQWNWTFGGVSEDSANDLIQTSGGDFVLVGQTNSLTPFSYQCRLVRISEVGFEHKRNYGVDAGLETTALTNQTITMYRGSGDPYWNYVRVRIWIIKEPTWQYGDINQDGVVDAKDLYILSRNYGKTFSVLSLCGIAAIASVHTYKKRKRSS